MVRKVQFEGRNIVVPDDATDDEVAQILDASSPLPVGAGGTPLEQLDKLNGALPPETGVPVADNRPFLSKYVTGPIRNAAETVIEPALAMASGLGSAIAGTAAGVGKEVITGDFGKGTAERVARGIQDEYTYQPRSEGAKAILGAAGDAFTASKIPVSPYTPMSTAAPSMAAAAIKQQMPLVASVAGKTAAPYLAARAAKAAELANESRVNAPRIDAAKAAERMNIAVSPLESNPTLMNRVKTGLIGQDEIGYAASRANEAVIPKVIRTDLEIPRNKPLNTKSIKAVRTEKGAPYAEVAKLEKMDADAQLLQDINSAYSFEGNTPAVVDLLKKDVPNLIDDVSTALSEGFNGNDALALSKKYRKESNMIYKKLEPSVEELAIADAKKAVSKAIESRVERRLAELDKEMPNQGYGSLAKRFKDARAYIAKSHVYENSMHGTTGVTDMSKLAKIASKDNALTGTVAELAEIASFFPQSVKVHPTISRTNAPHLSRAGVGGTLGFGVGSLFGAPVAGAVVGATAEMGGRIAGANRMISKSAQRGNLPKDYRSIREQLGYSDQPQARSLGFDDSPLPQSPQQPMPQGRGLLSLADEQQTSMPYQPQDAIDFPLQNRPVPIYQRGGIPVESGLSLSAPEPRIPTVPYTVGNVPKGRGLLSLTDELPISSKSNGWNPHEKGTVDFKLRQQVMDDLAPTTDALRQQLSNLMDRAERQQGFWRNRTQADIKRIEEYFRDGLKQIGIDKPSDAWGQAIYSAGGETKLPIQKSGRSGMMTGAKP